jgi:hypothetical protein
MFPADVSVEALAMTDVSAKYFCVNLRNLRETKPALKKIRGICIYMALFLL